MECQGCGEPAQYLDLNSSDRYCRECILAGRDDPDAASYLANAWDLGFTACQLRMSQAVLRMVPRKDDSRNPYAKD